MIWFFQITLPSLEPRGIATLTCIQKTFALLEVAASCCQMTQSPSVPGVHQSHDIAYDPVFATGDWVSCLIGMLLLVFPTASIRFWFVMCCDIPLLFRPQSISLNNWNEYMVPLCWRSYLGCIVPTLQWEAVVSLTTPNTHPLLLTQEFNSDIKF